MVLDRMIIRRVKVLEKGSDNIGVIVRGVCLW